MSNLFNVLQNTLNANVDDSRESSSDSIGSFAEIVTLTRLLDIFQHQSSVDHLDIGMDRGVQVSVVLRLVSCRHITITIMVIEQ